MSLSTDPYNLYPHSSLALFILSITGCLCPTSLCLTDPCPLTLPSPLGVERTLVLPGGQTAFDLDDVRAGLSYTVRVSARVGTREGSASSLTVRWGEHCRRVVGTAGSLTWS